MEEAKDQLKTTNGPYRATKLWNEIVDGFCTGIPLKKHRRQMRQYNDCFTARDGVDWLHNFLRENPNFSEDVSRYQSVQLLSKLLQCNIIIPVVSDTNSKGVFLDNQELYRLKSNRVVTQTRVPLKACHNHNTLSNANSKQETTEAELTGEEIEYVWKTTLLERLSTLLKVENVETDMNLSEINAKHMLHNVTRIGTTGIVLALNKAQQIPSWVYSAMKCLTAWPKACGDESCLPKYPGFEKDVFKAIEDYFKGLEEPLTTFSMFKPLTSVYERVMALTADVSATCLETEFSSEEPVTRLISPPATVFRSNRQVASSYSSLNKEIVCSPTVSVYPFLNLGGKNLSCSEDNLASPKRFSFKLKRNQRLATSTINLQSTHSTSSASLPTTVASTTSTLSLQSQRTILDRSLLLLECIRLLLLLLSPDSRRTLHQLLIFLEKVSQNEQLNLCQRRTNKQLLLETFCPLLVGCNGRKRLHTQTTISVATFLMENQQQIFEITEQFTEHVQTNLKQFQLKKCNSDSGWSYCEKVSKEEYERQKSQCFESAMMELLNSIIHNEQISQKDKQKKLRQFKKMHPDIYTKAFPADAAHPTGQKASNIYKQLIKLRSLRI